MMTFATLIEALYEAVEDHLRGLGKSNITEMNPKEKEVFFGTQIGRSVQEGLTNITVFHERTPSETWTNRGHTVPSFRSGFRL